MGRREDGKRRGLLRGKEGETVERGRQSEGRKEGTGKEKKVIKEKGRVNG